MKKYIYILLVAFCAAMPFSLVSCGDDDDDVTVPGPNGDGSTTVSKSTIIGTWLDSGGSEDNIVEETYWQFRADGQIVECCIWWGKMTTSGYEVRYGNWSLSGTTLTVRWEDRDELKTYTVATLTSERLVLNRNSSGETEVFYEGSKVNDSVISSYL